MAPLLTPSTVLRRADGTRVSRLRRPDGTELVFGATSSTGPVDRASGPSTAASRSLHPWWSTKLHPQARVAPTSTEMIRRLKAQFDAVPFADNPNSPYDSRTGGIYRTGVDEQQDYLIPIYRVPLDQPRVPVVAIRGGYKSKYYDSGGVRYYMQDDFEAVPLPFLDELKDGRIEPAGDDGSVIIICGNEMWELWRFRPLEAHREGHYDPKYRWQCEQGGYARDVRYHPLWWSSSQTTNPRGGDWGVSAAGMSYFGPILTPYDFNAPDILHPLTFALPVTGGAGSEPDWLPPATRADVKNETWSPDSVVDQYRLPEGLRIRLPADVWTDAVIADYAAAKGRTTASSAGATPPVLAKVMRAARDFGAVHGDTAGYIGFSAEANKTIGTIYSPFTDAQKPHWGDFAQQLPWGDFVQVAVPTVPFHTPGAGPTTPQTPAYDYSVAP